jgi:hypothetical protein
MATSVQALLRNFLQELGRRGNFFAAGKFEKVPGKAD